MRTRVAASTLLGATLVALVAVATVAVAWLLWARANDRGRVEDDRAALATSEALEGNLGRILAGLRAAAGLVDAEGEVDVESFRSYARAVGSSGAVDALGLAEIVPGGQREAFEIVLGRRISKAMRPGVFRSADTSESYVPIAAVWPDAGTSAALLGYDLQSEPRRRARSSALERGGTRWSPRACSSSVAEGCRRSAPSTIPPGTTTTRRSGS